MNTELEEMREALVSLLQQELPVGPCQTRAIIGKILSLQTPTCRLAVVEKEGKLPIITYPCNSCSQLFAGICQNPYGSCENKRVWMALDTYRKRVLNAGWVQEVKG